MQKDLKLLSLHYDIRRYNQRITHRPRIESAATRRRVEDKSSGDRKMGVVQDGAGRVDDRQTREILRRGQRLFARFEGRKRQPRRLMPPPLNFRNFCNALCSSNASIMSPPLLSETSDFACGGSFLFGLVLGIINYYQLF